MGEWGATNKDNYDQRINYYETYTNICKQGGLAPIAWMYEFNRNTLTWEYPLIEYAILQAYDPAYIPVETLELDITADTIYVGDTLQLSAVIYPDTASTQEIAWVSKNRSIASVNSSGLVTGNTRGSTEIVATTIGKSSVCDLVVLDTIVHLDFHFEAEEYKDHSGIQCEVCTDEGGGQNIGWIDNRDWCSYFMIIDSTAVYNFTARVATASGGGTIEIKDANNVLGEVKVEDNRSNGWQDWYTTDPVEILLREGTYDLKLIFKGTGSSLLNVNWFDINYQIDFQSDADIRILNITGNVVRNLENYTNKLPGNYTLSWERKNLPKGLYFLILTQDNRTFTKKILLN